MFNNLWPSANNPVSLLKSNKEGTIYASAEDQAMYLQVFAASFCLFFSIYYFWQFFFSYLLKRKSYEAKSDMEKAYYLSTWTANVHHLFIFLYSAY